MDSQIITERRPTSIEFFFDPQCPFAYQTSLWIREVAHETGMRVQWRFFSLEEVNHQEGDLHPWEKEWSRGWSLMRVGALLREQDPSLLDRWYAAIGKAIHEEGRPAYEPEVAREIVTELGLPADTIERALSDPATSQAVAADHEWLVATHGGFGVPTLVFPWGKAVYGPVVAPAPNGDEALRLWNLLLQWAQIPYLYELKAPKSTADEEHIREVFAPTFRAREAATSG
jgi:2-hydroxychromene-2-carboxylate isomerase